MVTTQTADNVLKSYYLNAVSDQLNKAANPLLAKIRQTTADVWGRDVRKAVRIGVNGGIGAGTESGDLPTAGGNRYAQFVSSLKNLYGTIEISDKAIRSSASNEGAFVNLLNDEMDGLVKSSSFNFGRMLFGDGTGKLCSFVASTTGYTVDSVQNIAEGMIVDVVTSSSVIAAGRTITGIDYADKKITLSGAAVTAAESAGAYLVLQGSKGLELTGLKAIFDGDTLYGLSRGDNPWMKPYTSGSVGELTETKLQTAIDTVEERTGGKINFIVTSPGVRRAFAETLASRRQIETMELEGGFHAISFNGIPVVSDRFCPKNTVYLLNTDDFCLHQLCDWQWLEGEDGKVLKQIPGKPLYTATLVKYAELMCYRPCGQARLTGVTEK